MKVNTLGFRLKAIGAATLSDLAERLVHKTANDTEFKFRGHVRRLYASVTTSHGEMFAIGLFLTIRDHKKFLQLTEKDGTIGVTVTELDDDSRPFDFNFYIFHPASGSGLYSHYHFSCSFPVFHKLLLDQYLRANKEQEEGKTVDEKKKVRASKKKDLKFSMFHRRDSFEDAVAELSQVSQFEYDILTPESMTSELQPIGTKLKLERRQIRFEANVSGTSFLEKVKNLLPASPSNGQRFRVIGKDPSGDKIPIDLIAPPDHFGEDEYDDLADDETLRLDSIQESVYVKKLLATFHDRKELFTANAG